MRLQNEDIKSLAQIVDAGGDISQLPNDAKIYLKALKDANISVDKTLQDAILEGFSV